MPYCIKCGAQIPEGVKLCVNCQQRAEGPAASGPQAQAGPETGAGQGVYRLTVTRKDQFYLVNPAMKVSVDGVERLHVDNGATMWVDLPAGIHMLGVKSSFRKKELCINMSRNMMVVLSWNRLTGEIEAETFY